MKRAEKAALKRQKRLERKQSGGDNEPAPDDADAPAGDAGDGTANDEV